MTAHGVKTGRRLADRRDPAARIALGRTCPTCGSTPDQWCVGVAENSRTKGRRRSRLHFARCLFTIEVPVAHGGAR